MRIKINRPGHFQHNQTARIFWDLWPLAAIFVIYTAILIPLLIPVGLTVGIFAFFVCKKRPTAPRRGSYFTYMTFGQDGVLLEKSNPKYNVFLPYEQTSFDLSASLDLVQTRSGPRLYICSLNFTFTQHGAAKNRSENLFLSPPLRAFPFLARILALRERFAGFSCRTEPGTDPEAAEIMLKKLDGYYKTGFMSAFTTNETRTTFLLVGLLFLGADIYCFCTAPLHFFLKDYFFPFTAFAAYFFWPAFKDMVLEYKSRFK